MALLARIRNQRQRMRRTEFLTPEQAFTPQVEVFPTRDITGWLDKPSKKKFHLKMGHSYCVDEKLAREWSVKGYVQIGRGEVRAVSEDEAAEILSSVTTVNMGVPNG